jgi:hypothetical protein
VGNFTSSGEKSWKPQGMGGIISHSLKLLSTKLHIRPTEIYSLNSGKVDCHTAVSYISGLTSHNVNCYTLTTVGRITGRLEKHHKTKGVKRF